MENAAATWLSLTKDDIPCSNLTCWTATEFAHVWGEGIAEELRKTFPRDNIFGKAKGMDRELIKVLV